MAFNNIIGISGKAGSGKDTVAEYLVEKHGYMKISFADPLKRFAASVFGYNAQQLWGPSEFRNAEESMLEDGWYDARKNLEKHGKLWLTEIQLERKKRAEIDEQYVQLLHWFDGLQRDYPSAISPRVVLQTLGTEFGRHVLGKEVWVEYMIYVADKVLEPGHTYTPVSGLSSSPTPTGVIVSDLRFLNEIKAINLVGGKIIKITRSDAGDTPGVENHASEKEQEQFSAENFDFLLNNEGSLDDLFAAVDVFAKGLV